MDHITNPLIYDNSLDTLHHAHCVLLLLESLHANNDGQWLQEQEIATGIASVLRCANEAIAYEIDRMSNT